MKQLQRETSINQLALAMHNLRNATRVVDRAALEHALEPLKAVIKQAYMRGGKFGAAHVRDMVRRRG